MGIPDHLTCLQKNLYVGQETVRTLYGTIDWFKMEKGVWQGWLLSPRLFNLYAEHIMRNAGLDEWQAIIKIGRKNINNLRYEGDTALMTESKEELKSLFFFSKEPLDEGEGGDWKSQLKTKYEKNLRSWHRSHHLMASDVKNWLIGKVPNAGKDWGQKEKRVSEDEMVEWHHWLNGHEFG